jgi:hypothetical protein
VRKFPGRLQSHIEVASILVGVPFRLVGHYKDVAPFLLLRHDIAAKPVALVIRVVCARAVRLTAVKPAVKLAVARHGDLPV